MHDDLAHWYRTLELEPGASLEEVNQAYKDLAVVWHPDRLPQDSARLQEKAQAKLKEINNARDRLREYQADKSTQTNHNGSTRSQSASTKADSSRTNRTASNTSARTDTTRTRSTSQQQQPRRAAAERNPQPAPKQNAETNGYPHPQAARVYQQAQTKSSTPPQRPDLTGVDWSGMDLNERDFANRNLSNANLSNSSLKDSFLHGTNLQGADLSNANLFRANLFQANLSNANLRGANLISADLSGADLSGADLTGARIRVGTRMTVRLIGANLTGTIMPDGSVYAKS
jgi:uncharacterized protein YjbI with pentapeptide repeats